MSKGTAQQRTEAMEALLLERGLLQAGAVDDVITRYNERVGPMNGARVVAKAWKDAQFKAQLLQDGTAAVAPFEFEGGELQKLVVVLPDHVHWYPGTPTHRAGPR